MKEIAKGIRYIGVDHTDLDLFESQYTVPEGMAYNSYLILDEKVAILDTADARKAEEWLGNLQEALEGREPDYLVIHHMEPDHSSLVGAVLEAHPAVTLVGSAMALKFLGQFLPGKSFPNTLVVKEGDSLPLGEHSLKFYAAPMVHWPEVMVSVDEATGVLFFSPRMPSESSAPWKKPPSGPMKTRTGPAKAAAIISTSAASMVPRCRRCWENFHRPAYP